MAFIILGGMGQRSMFKSMSGAKLVFKELTGWQIRVWSP